MNRGVLAAVFAVVVLAGIIIIAAGQKPQPALNGTNVSGNMTGNSTGGVNSTPPKNTTPEVAPPPAINVSKLAEKGLRMGSDDAPVIMVEYSDYQCQFCRRFWQMNFATLKEQYLDTGLVQLVYRDLPLSFHNAAEASAQAAACAEDQGKGWEMHDKIFGVQANVSTGLVFYAKSDLKQWAGEIGVDQAEFDSCLDSGKYSLFVNESRDEALSLGFNATPSFAMGLRNGTNYVTLTGALPYGTFKATLDELLSQ
ncbi:MAG TPA: thioredoxin domain-containing protein [Candidatus Bilamarchaeum sp.]|nr:thioredoxin domain-containing protein [Candidatus Bilamarchaeum sp.]